MLGMGGYTVKAYDRLWEQVAGTTSPQQEERIKETRQAIPDDCRSVLDIGCGDGRITNALAATGADVVGVDLSLEALRYVQASKVLASVDALPFRNASFDIVLCTELLEHLPFTVYHKALSEVARVSRNYILVSVPDKQDLESSLVACPYCGCRFNADRHVRAFEPGHALDTLFVGFIPLLVRTVGLRRMYPARLVRLALKLAGAGTGFPAHAVCPQCGYATPDTKPDGSGHAPSVGMRLRLLRLVGKVVPKRTRGNWLLALYRRSRASGVDGQ